MLRRHFGEAQKLMLQSYSSTPELCRILFTSADSYELQHYKSNVSSPESKQKKMQGRKSKEMQIKRRG